jgi:hypothetical protein
VPLLSSNELPLCNGFTSAINATYAFGHVVTTKAYLDGGFTFGLSVGGIQG